MAKTESKYFKKNFTGDNPKQIYVSKKTGKVFMLKATEDEIDLDNPITGISLLCYDFVSENNSFKIYDLKKSLQESNKFF